MYLHFHQHPENINHRSPGYVKVPVPLASLIRLIILPVTFQTLGHVGAPGLPFNIISSLPRALLLMQRSWGKDSEEDRKRRLLPVLSCKRRGGGLDDLISGSD